MVFNRLRRAAEKLAIRYYEQSLLRDVKKDSIPQHVAIILDGNRRFSQRLKLQSFDGYALGAKKLEEVLGWCEELGIKHVTVFAFSTENFDRPKEEVDMLMNLIAEKCREVARDERVHKRGIRIHVIGDLTRLPEHLRAAIREVEGATEGYDRYFLNLAVSYGGRYELVEAVRKLCKRVQEGDLDPADIDERVISDHLYTVGSPDPDLIIRTSGEERLSGFLLWQSAYSELYFCEANWPEFSKVDFLRAIRSYQGRSRRFGR